VRLDGDTVATIKRGETVAIPVDDGWHDLQLAIAWCRSAHVPAIVAERQLACFTCRPGDGTAMWKITLDVRDDLEFALEHIPGTGVGPWRPDPEQWKRMPEYDDLQLHIARLRALRDQT